MRIYSTTKIEVDGIPIEVTRKRVKYLRIVVNRSSGKVRISSPRRLWDAQITRFAESKIDWVKKQLEESKGKFQEKPKPLDYSSGEEHPVWGKSYRLELILKDSPPKVWTEDDGRLLLQVRPGSDRKKREQVMREWYRKKIKREIPPLIKKWEPIMGVKVNDWGVKKMKTRWGTCNTRKERIWLSLDLATMAPEFLEYIVVHEMTHLLERLHSRRFYRLMDSFMDDWRDIDKKLGGKHWRKRA